MKPTVTHCAFHLGDNLAALHFLRRAALAHPDRLFIHLAHACHHPELHAVVEDIPNLSLADIEKVTLPERGLNVWKNADGFWQNHPHKDHWCRFHRHWHDLLAMQTSVTLPALTADDDLRLDYPALSRPRGLALNFPDRYDFLVVNSRPCSGQFRAYDSVEYLSPFIAKLAERFSVVVTQQVAPEWQGPNIRCTAPLNLTGIGSIALNARNLIMVSTGPSWTAMNRWNTPAGRRLRLGAPGECILLIDRERVNFSGVTHCRSRERLTEIAKANGWIDNDEAQRRGGTNL